MRVEQVIAAEVEYCVREEWARSLADIKRRTRLASGPCQSCRCAAGTSLFLSSYLGWDSQRLPGRSGRLQRCLLETKPACLVRRTGKATGLRPFIELSFRRSEALDRELISSDVTVIGAGIAGFSAAISSKARGLGCESHRPGCRRDLGFFGGVGFWPDSLLGDLVRGTEQD